MKILTIEFVDASKNRHEEGESKYFFSHVQVLLVGPDKIIAEKR